MKRFVSIIIVCALSACATPYQPHGHLGGYSEKIVDKNTFLVSTSGNINTNQQTMSNYALYRAAELTLQNKFDYFVIDAGEDNLTTMSMLIPKVFIGGSVDDGLGVTHAPAIVIPNGWPNITI